MLAITFWTLVLGQGALQSSWRGSAQPSLSPISHHDSLSSTG